MTQEEKVALGVVADEAMAHRLVMLLAQEGIGCEPRPQAGQWQLLVAAEDLLAAQQALARLEQQARQRNQQAWQVNQPLTAAPFRWQQLWRGGKRFGPLTLLLLALCVLVYLSPLLVGGRVYELLQFAPQLDGLLSEPWRLFTPALLHFGMIHIAFNMVWWLQLGSVVEQRQSTARLLGLFLLLAALPNLVQFLLSGPNFGGMSGVIYGLLGYCWLWGKQRPQDGVAVSDSIAIFMLAWLLLCWTGLLGPIANGAHLAGLIAGLLLAQAHLLFGGIDRSDR